MADKKADGSLGHDPTKDEIDRFDRLSGATFMQVFNLIEQYIKANEKLGASGQHMSKALKACVESRQGDHIWAKTVLQLAESQNTMETLRSSVLEKPIENLVLKEIKSQLNADKDSLEHFKKKLKSAMKKLESKEEKLRQKIAKGKEDKGMSAELKEIETKKAELLAIFRAYESRQYHKWIQQFVQLLEMESTYHATILSMLTSLQPTWTAAQDKKPDALPPDTWTAYVQNPEQHAPAAPTQPPIRLAPAGPPSPTPAAAAPAAAVSAPAPAAAPAAAANPAVASLAASPSTNGLKASPSSAGTVASTSSAAPAAAATPACLVNAPKPKAGSVWKLFPTDDGEDYYYFNEQTGESIWELPEAELAH